MKSISPKYKGILLIVASAFCFAFMNAFVRMAGALPATQKSFFRNLVALGIAIVMFSREAKDFSLPKGTLLPLFLRSAFGTIGILCNYYAIDHLVLSDASMLNKMSPFFTIVFSWLLLKEKLRPVQGLAVLTAFAGSLLIVKPSLDFSNFKGSLAGLCGGIAAGAAYSMVRILGNKGVNKTFIVLCFSGFSCFCMLPFLIFDFHSMTIGQLLALIGAGCAGAGGQFTITAAYCCAPAKEISVYDYTNILFTAAWGLIAFSEMPDALSICGYIIIIAMAILKWRQNINS